jgi:hypothetical protein
VTLRISIAYYRLLTSRYDKVAEHIGSPTAKQVTAKLHQFNADKSRMEGLGNELIEARKGYSEEEIRRENEYSYKLSQGNKQANDIQLTAKELALRDKLNSIYKKAGQQSIDAGMKVTSGNGDFREMALKKDGYRPPILSADVAHAWAENLPEAKQYDKLFVDYMTSKGVEEPAKLLKEYKQSMSNASDGSGSTKYGPLRKVQGEGLPWELVEQNANRASTRYARRFAQDINYFKHFQNDPQMLKALGIEDQFGKKFDELPADVQAKYADTEEIGNRDVVKQAMRSVYGVDVPKSPRVQALVRALGSSIMQTGTAARNLVQLPGAIAPYDGVNLKSVFKAAATMNEKAQRAFANNAIKSSYKDIDAAGDFAGNPDKFVRMADKYVEFMRKWTGRDLSDKWESLFSYSLGEDLATKWFAQAKTGDMQARQMLNRFGNTLPELKSKMWEASKEVTPEDIAHVAKNFSDAVRGTYSAAGLPSAAIEGPMAPFLSLSRWSIERANIFQKDVVNPIREHGNWMPLLKTAFVGLMSGAAIEQLNELLSGRKGQDASIKEVMAEPDAENITAKAIGLAQLGSFGGIISDAMKLGMNAYQGKDNKFSTPISYPLATAAQQMEQQTEHMITAIHQGEDPFEVLSMYMTDIVKSLSQNARYASNRLDDDGTDRKNALRDVRVFDDLTHKPNDGSASVANVNPYVGLDEKKFKKTANIEEAAQQLPAIIKDYVAKYANDPEMLQQKLSALKHNSYDTMPSPDHHPLEFMKYVKFLKETKGDDEATQVLLDYFKVNALNEAKSGMVP